MPRSFARPPTLADAVAAELREVILSGGIPPGSRLRETALSEMFGVSRATIRDALQANCEIGLVAHTPHRGAHIPKLALRVTQEVLDLRALLEPHAVTQAGKGARLTPALAEALHETSTTVVDDARDGAFLRESVTFHRTLCSASENGVLVHSLERPLWMSALAVASCPSRVPATRFAAIHSDICKYVEMGDALCICQLLTEHLREMTAILHEGLAQ
jgi:DNA-binding GntR family transcriptional regulator